MLKKSYLAVTLLISVTAQAGLTGLDTQELQEVRGQGGADFNWTLSLNHRYANDLSLKDISTHDAQTGLVATVNDAYYTYSCQNNVQCRLAISPNNHTEGGNQKWLVFKQIQGTLQIEKFSLAGTTIINKNGDPQTAMKLSFYDDKPLKIRNLGFNNLAVESDTDTEKGYLKTTVYNQYQAYTVDSTGKKTTFATDIPAFDKDTETGFMGLNMHGNLHMFGDLKIFSYNCTGASGARC